MTAATTTTELEQRLTAHWRAAEAVTKDPTSGRKAAATRRLSALCDQWHQDVGGTDDEFATWLMDMATQRGEIDDGAAAPTNETPEPEAPAEVEEEESEPSADDTSDDDKSPFEGTSDQDDGRITMNANAILGLVPHCSKEESRPALHGVLLRSDGVGIATNGRTLVMYRHAHNSIEDVLVVFPPAASKVLREAAKKGTGEIWLNGETLEYPLISGRCLVDRREDATYPKVEQVLPKTKPKKLGTFAINPNVLALFKANTEQAVRLTLYNADRAIVVTTSDPNFYGIVMPCRLPDGDGSQPPEWAYRKDVQAVA